MITADNLREKYLEFFRTKGHKVVSSDSLAPKDDPTVLFTPAGMNQFKKQFLGLITDFTRAASSQRCLRTDDLEKVGKTDCHHTFFEMLGNFSFGDYFKEEAISWAWEFLTQELKIQPEKLAVSVYKDDEEAYNIWKDKVNFPEEKIIKLGDHDNFWPADAKEKGPNGPCGPCSEIFFDLGPEVGCKKSGCTPECGCGRFIEIWNLVFTQFNRKEGGILEPLPQKNIDTGMGLERITSVMQGVRSNFETDLFQPPVKEIKSHVKNFDSKYTTTIYAVCDHIRAVVFSIFDGILPSNEARGYVVRKLIRKSVLHLQEMGIKEPFLYKLVPLLAEVMKKPYPELVKSREDIADIILAEENNFISILDSSETLVMEKINDLGLNSYSPESFGELVFCLHDTHGIPLEITKSILEKNNISFPPESGDVFERELNLQKDRSKAGSAMKGDVFSVKDFQLKNVQPTVFTGYEGFSGQAKIVKILLDSGEADRVVEGQVGTIILDYTPFYAESGGQSGDSGTILADGNIFEVTDTLKTEKIFLHTGKVKSGSFKAGDIAQANVDMGRRMAIARNHTATHLLQAALRKVLGTHVQQQGSYVAEERLRFDFTHHRGVKSDELNRVEEIVNGYVIENLPVTKKEMTLAEARQEGALAFFAEKYEDKVRVVSVEGVSKEFCGGTHLDFTGAIGLFKILNESSIASGVRRIEACTGTTAYKAMKAQEDALLGISQALKIPQDKLAGEVEKRLKQIRDLEKEISALKLNNVAASIDELLKHAEVINGIKIITSEIQGADMAILRKTADLLKQKETGIIIALGATMGELVSFITASNIGGVDSSALIKQIAPEIGGSGGGRKDFAQAGGTQPENIEKAFAKLKEIIRQGKFM
ncbi:MAG: alanine--tRNA ligase [Candidatus Omnitrophota bacterium]